MVKFPCRATVVAAVVLLSTRTMRASDMIYAAGFKPDQSTLELEPGKGWFADILLRLIGPEVHQPALLDGFFGKDARKRVQKASALRAHYSDAPFAELAAADATIDRVFWIQEPHEIWFEPKPGVTFGDPQAIFAEIQRVLRPDGMFFVVDNLAKSGLISRGWVTASGYD